MLKSDRGESKTYLYKRLVTAKTYIDQHWDEQIDINEISGKSFFSKFHFIRLFKKSFGDTPYQYLTKIRIQEAKKMLENGMTVTRVSEQVGFESFASFSLLFKKIAKISPKKYQIQKLKKLIEQKEYPLHFIPGCFLPFDTGEQEIVFQS
jgi:AraC-like DNA-binding protein